MWFGKPKIHLLTAALPIKIGQDIPLPIVTITDYQYVSQCSEISHPTAYRGVSGVVGVDS